jgi:deoxycytidine triphosphate deaminase
MEEFEIRIWTDTELLFPTPFMLSDRGIRKSIDSGEMNLNADDFTDKQIQPVSLDLRIGRVSVYDQDSVSKMVSEYNKLSLKQRLGDYEFNDKYAKKYPDEKGLAIDIPPISFFEVEIHEKVKTDFLKRVDLRSSRGRLGLQIESFDGSRILGIRNYNPNPIRLYSRTSFAQMFFHTDSLVDGRVVRDFDEAREIGAQLGVPTCGPYLLFQLGQYAYRFRNIGLIDTGNLNEKQSEDLYDKVELKKFFVPAGETIISQLEPKVNLPEDLAIQLINMPYVQCGFGGIKPNPEILFCEQYRTNAGLADPGYNGNLTAHLRRTKSSVYYNQGMNIVLGVIIQFTEPVQRPYGSKGLGSHYQGSEGSVSRS